MNKPSTALATPDDSDNSIGRFANSAPNRSGFELTAPDSEAAYKLCERLARSNIIPKDFTGKPENIYVVGIMGHRLGLDLFASMNGIAAINGRPTIWGDVALAVCQSDPKWDRIKEWIDTDAKGLIARCELWLKGAPEPIRTEFSQGDAVQASLWNKQGPWQQYPKRMLQMRARGFALRTGFAARLQGILLREEMEGVEVEVAGVVTSTEPAPAKRKSKAAKLDEALAQERQEAPAKDAVVDNSMAPDAGAKDATVIDDTPTPTDDEKAKIAEHVANNPPQIALVPVKTLAELVKRATDYAAAKNSTDDIEAIKKKLNIKKLSAIDPSQIPEAWNLLDIFEGKPVTYQIAEKPEL